MDRSELTSRIRDEALRLQFDAVGFAPAQRLDNDLLGQWLDRGYHGEMAYMARNVERRLDPSQVLSGARSVISVALLYRHPEPGGSATTDPPGRGRISRYARGTDYHLILHARLEELAGTIERISPEAQARIYVDTGPVMEKSWAVKAGIGWQGKNTNILNRHIGSWFFLGEIITDLELEYDEPVRDYCGSCTKCIDACPTDALEPYVLDSRRCISYLTIELRGEIPEEHREATGPWIFGCDICQDVCPWNRKSPFSTVPEFQPKPGVEENDLVSLARMTPEQFSERYRNTAIKRSKWRGLMRNVAVALGNTGGQEGVPELKRLLEDEDPMLRRHAAWALARLGSETALRLLEQRKRVETDTETLTTLETLIRESKNGESSTKSGGD